MPLKNTEPNREIEELISWVSMSFKGARAINNVFVVSKENRKTTCTFSLVTFIFYVPPILSSLLDNGSISQFNWR